ncbi:MAG: GNAT family N-acetyltransferase [Thalassovita sp.]
MLRKAASGDQAGIDAFLAKHPNSSMFLRSNLASHGIGQSDHRHATDFYLSEVDDTLEGMVGVTRQGFVMCQAPQVSGEVWQGFAAALQAHKVAGLNGEDTQISKLNQALNFGQDDFSFNHVEPLFRLDLAGLRIPDVDTRLPDVRDLDQLTRWFMAYNRDTGLPVGKNGPLQDAIARAHSAIDSRNTRLLMVEGQSVAMTSFNARYGDMVQIGGVYTPPEHRNKGYARQVVASHLAEVLVVGINTAILFANNEAAARAYQAIGFTQIGHYRVSVLKTPREPGAPL